MKKKVIFIHGAGEGAYKADQMLADSVQEKLRRDYEVIYPEMPDEENAPYEQWKDTLTQKLAVLDGPVILVGHSIGASFLAKFIGEVNPKSLQGIYLLASPFWGGDGWLYEGYEELQLPADISSKFPKNVPVYLYHCRDDEVVPFNHLSLYAQILPKAIIREVEVGGHQFNNDLSIVASDIKGLLSSRKTP